MVVQLKAVIYSKIKGLGRGLPKIRKEVFQDAGEYWVQQLFPDHFKPAARSEFQYLPRDKEWIKAKRKFGRGQGKVDDLVFSGRSRRFMMEGPSIKATSMGVTVRLDSPIYFRFPRYKTSGHPDKVVEVTRISERHRKFLFKRMKTTTVSSIRRVLRDAPLKKVKG